MKLKLVTGFLLLLFATSCSRIETTQPLRKDIIDAVFASGFIIDENEYLVIASTDGYLDKSLVKEGDSVKKGTQLFLLSNEVQTAQFETAQSNYNDAKTRNDANSPQIQQLKLQIEQAKTQLANDETNYNRYSNLVKTGAVSQFDFDKIKLQYETSKKSVAILEKSLQDMQRTLELNEKNAAAQLDIQQRNRKDYFLTSNINGTVMTVSKNQGEYVRKGEVIAKLGDGKSFAKLFVAEEDIERVKLKDKAVISLNTDKQKTYNAFISKIYPAFDDKQQSFFVEAKFVDLPENLLYNTQLQANIIVDEKSNALIIPAKFLVNENSVELKNGKKIQIKKGISNNEFVEVLDGLTESQIIVFHINKK